MLTRSHLVARLSRSVVSSKAEGCCRAYSNVGPPKQQSSIFAGEEPAWDHILQNIPSQPPLISNRYPHTARHHHTAPRRQDMTARERAVFDDMFNQIFAAAEATNSSSTSSGTPASIKDTSIGKLYQNIRHSNSKTKRIRWTTESEDLLDQKQEEMNLCDTDQQLLEYAMDNVFAVEESDETVGLPVLQPPLYSRLVAILMKTFRDKYRDPHLALAMFDHARNLSIPSYVFGCSTYAYNELIQTRWQCFKDLRGVLDALEEMDVNGVALNSRTFELTDTVRRGVNSRNEWVENTEIGGRQVYDILQKIEGIVLKSQFNQNLQEKNTGYFTKPAWNAWKTDGAEDDNYTFNEWDTSFRRKSQNRVS